MLKTLVVIPAYNEALNIKKTVIDLKIMHRMLIMS